MPLVHLVIALALLEFIVFVMAVGKARATYAVPAPATSGNEVFERYFRVQMNTLEQLVVFVPAILLFGAYVHPLIAAALGLVFVIGRWVYFRGYVKDPKQRETGFILSALPNVILLLGGLIGIVRVLFMHPHNGG
jgi:glutathione S-transferase